MSLELLMECSRARAGSLFSQGQHFPKQPGTTAVISESKNQPRSGFYCPCGRLCRALAGHSSLPWLWAAGGAR